MADRMTALRGIFIFYRMYITIFQPDYGGYCISYAIFLLNIENLHEVGVTADFLLDAVDNNNSVS